MVTVVIEVLGSLLVFGLAVMTLRAMWIGLLGIVGAAKLVHCDRCARLCWGPLGDGARRCARCRARYDLHWLDSSVCGVGHVLFHPVVQTYVHLRRGDLEGAVHRSAGGPGPVEPSRRKRHLPGTAPSSHLEHKEREAV